MNLAAHRFTLSTLLVAACATVALVGAESVHAQPPVPLQRIEIVGQRFVPTQLVVIVGQRYAEPALQRSVVVGERQRGERVAAAGLKARAL